jgi:hypothetical protein
LEFTEQGIQHDFSQFYNTRVDLLTKESRKKGKAGRRFTDLMEYFNSNLFPSDDSKDSTNGMDQEEQDLYDAIEEDDEGEEMGEDATGEDGHSA